MTRYYVDIAPSLQAAIEFSSQVSPDASNPVASADWGWPGSGYWIAIGVPVSG